MADAEGLQRRQRAREAAPHGLDVELVWTGKGTRPAREPVQLGRSFLHVAPESRESALAGSQTSVSALETHTENVPNRLILGENGGVLAALAPLVRAEGGVRVAYMDPPFAVQADFEIELGLGGAPRGRARDLAFDDTWGESSLDRASSYLTWLDERVRLVHALLADDGTFYLHVDARVSAWASCVLDEVFGRAQRYGWIVWRTGNGAKARSRWSLQHNDLLVYAKSQSAPFFSDDPVLREPFADASQRTHFQRVDAAGRRYRSRKVNGREYVYFADKGRMVGSVWTDCPSMSANSPLLAESTGYPTQKPERLLERVLAASSRPGDLVLDACVGSGTTLAVAERLGRRWIGIDMGEHAVATTRKRLIGQWTAADGARASGSVNAATISAEPARSFEILVARPLDSRPEVLAARIGRELGLEPHSEMGSFLGARDGALVALARGANEPACLRTSGAQIDALVAEALRLGVGALEVLALELEPDVLPGAVRRARERGLELALLRLPRAWIEDRKERAHAHPFGWLEGRLCGSNDAAQVEITALGWAARADVLELESRRLARGASRYVAHAGGLSRIERTRGSSARDATASASGLRVTTLTRTWLDAIDMWAVDTRAGANALEFRAEWLARRTPRARELASTSTPLACPTGVARLFAVDVLATTLYGVACAAHCPEPNRPPPAAVQE